MKLKFDLSSLKKFEIHYIWDRSNTNRFGGCTEWCGGVYVQISKQKMSETYFYLVITIGLRKKGNFNIFKSKRQYNGISLPCCLHYV